MAPLGKAWIVLCVAGGALLLPGGGVAAGAGAPKPKPRAMGAASGATPCTVSDGTVAGWIESPSLPADAAGTDPTCFYNFAWQQFFALAALEGNVPAFATWPTDQELFPASGEPAPWKAGLRPMKVRPLKKGRGLPGSAGPFSPDIVTEAAALVPLVDQRGRLAQFSALANSCQYQYIRDCELYKGNCFNTMGGMSGSSPKPGSSLIVRLAGSVELKPAFRVLETCNLPDSPKPCKPEDPRRYITVQGEVPRFPPPANGKGTMIATLGLVGLHIVQKTPGHPENVWATFEHVDNAPPCAGTPPAPPAGFSGWQFYDASCQDPGGTDPTRAGRCQKNWYCSACPIKTSKLFRTTFNSQVKAGAWTIPPDPDDPQGGGLFTCTPSTTAFNKALALPDGTSVQVNLFDASCARPPIPTQVCRAGSSDPAVQALNGQVQRVLTSLYGSSTALASYRLAGAQWSSDDPPAGVADLANTTMETYLQTLPSGCMTCHTPPTASQPINPVPQQLPMAFNAGLADRSMIFQQIRQLGPGSECSQGQAARCGPWIAAGLAGKGCPAPDPSR